MLTGEPLSYNFGRGKHYHHLYWWSDEQINVISCDLLIVGTALFLVGTVLFFPGFPASVQPNLTKVASFMFIAGSVFFVTSALVDYLRLRRNHSKYTQFDWEPQTQLGGNDVT